MQFAPGCFWSPYSRPTFLSIFPCSPVGKISENGRFRCLCQICNNSALRTLTEPQFAAKCYAMFALQVHTNLEMMQFALRCFRSPYSRPTFLSIFPWSPLGKISEITDLGDFAKFVITRLYGHLRSRSLQQNAVLCLHFKCILIRRWCNLRQGEFEAPIVGLLFLAFSLGPPLTKSQKMADLGVFAKFVLTRLHKPLGSRSLQQNAVLCLHFKCILIRRWCNLRQGVFEAPIVGLLFWAFSLGPPLAKSQKMADLGVFAKFVITRLYGHLRSRSLQQNAMLCLHFKCILIRRWCNLRQGVFEAPIVGLLFWAFSLGPPLAKSQKMADLGVFAKFVITRLYGHSRSRSLQQNAVLCLLFKCILIRRWCILRQGAFEATIVSLLFSAFSLGPLLAKSRK